MVTSSMALIENVTFTYRISVVKYVVDRQCFSVILAWSYIRIENYGIENQGYT